MRRLNMWQRLGVVASVVWIIGAGLWLRASDVGRAQRMMQSEYQPCSEVASQLTNGAIEANQKCMTEALKTFEIMLQGSWGNAAIFAFGSTLLAWIAVYAIARTTRWVFAGRNL